MAWRVYTVQTSAAGKYSGVESVETSAAGKYSAVVCVEAADLETPGLEVWMLEEQEPNVQQGQQLF